MTGKCGLPGALALLLLGVASLPAPPLSLIQDTLYQADGTRFHGTAYIQWKSFDASDTSVVQMQSLMIRIVDGVIRASLVPTTTATSSAYYQVRFNSNGRTQFIENWAVPPSTAPLRLRDVRIQGPLTGATVPPAAAIIINDVTGLRDELDARAVKAPGYSAGRVAIIDADGALDGVLGSPTDCIRVDGTAVPCASSEGLSPVFVDAERPFGSVDGTNNAFTLSVNPSPAMSLHLYRNGLLQKAGLDFNLSGSGITFVPAAIPASGDLLQAWYRTAAATASPIYFVDGEIPSGVVNGINLIFTLENVPNPTSSLQLFRNGVLLRADVDYIISGTNVTFTTAAIPQSGDSIVVSYRR
jgi:hypothetical protein